VSVATCEGILPIIKPEGKTSFYLVKVMRRVLGVKKVGHTGTLDPFASGVMVLVIGKKYTRQSDSLMADEKEYEATFHLGICTDTYDIEGKEISRSDKVPTLSEVKEALSKFQGSFEQIPPMFSAKKVGGKKLYEMARKGQVIERAASTVTAFVELISYDYPSLNVRIRCSKGTYIRTLGYDIGKCLGCGAFTKVLKRTRNGAFSIEDCYKLDMETVSYEQVLPFLHTN
jgi:tRNA pseudouridine55 synthase